MTLNCSDSSGTADTYWYGSLSNGYSLYVPGSIMTLEYQGLYSFPGFQLVYNPADPGSFFSIIFLRLCVYLKTTCWSVQSMGKTVLDSFLATCFRAKFT